MARVKVGADFFNILVDGRDDKPALFVCHSLAANMHMWDRQIPALTRHFRVIRYDSRGHGDSDATRGPYSIWRLGRDALAIMDELGVARAHFLGLSMGGMVGLWLLANARERIGRAVLANAAAAAPPPDLWNNRIRMARENGMSAIAQMFVDLWFAKAYQERAPEQVAHIRAMLAATPAHGYAAACAAIRDMDQRETVRSISNPVMLIAGAHDKAIPPDRSRFLAEAIPGAKLLLLEAGHLCNIEMETAFTEAVVAFLTGKPEAGVGRGAAKPPARSRPKTKRSRASARKPAKKKATTKRASAKAPKKATKKAGKAQRPRKAASQSARKAVRKTARKPAKKSRRK